MPDDFRCGRYEEQLKQHEKRLDNHAMELKKVMAWQNRAAAYIGVIVFIASKLFDALTSG